MSQYFSLKGYDAVYVFAEILKYFYTFGWGNRGVQVIRFFLLSESKSFVPFLHAVPRAIKTIVALQDDDNSEEEEGNSEDQGGENFSVSDVFELF